jgi:hypothetical protein
MAGGGREALNLLCDLFQVSHLVGRYVYTRMNCEYAANAWLLLLIKRLDAHHLQGALSAEVRSDRRRTR